MKKTYLNLLLIITTIQISCAQKRVGIDYSLIDFQRLIKFNKISGDHSKNYEGSPYLDKKFYIGEIITEDNHKYSDIPLRYNNYKDVIEFERDGVAFEIPTDFPISKIVFNGLIYYRNKYIENNNSNIGYFELVNEGKINLYQRKKIRLQDAKEATAHHGPIPPTFKVQPISFFMKIKGEVDLIKFKNKKEFVKILSDKKLEVESYMKKNKLKTNNSEDLIKIINYYSSL